MLWTFSSRPDDPAACRLSPGTAKLACNHMEMIFGIHAVEEALEARGRGFEYVAVLSGRGDARHVDDEHLRPALGRFPRPRG